VSRGFWRRCVMRFEAEVVHRAPITWLGKICGFLVAMIVMMALLLPFIYRLVFT
jgi:hypothetical protein